jgi:DMSO/TMAO reductase YedYZ molybdopterin-dependent catalytic subunit
MPQRHAGLPIACVEGWSVSAAWSGVPLRYLLEHAGVSPASRVRVESLERNGIYTRSVVDPEHARDADTLLALRLNGEVLDLDHGYPVRLIAPNRPGVLQTKWVSRLVVE